MIMKWGVNRISIGLPGIIMKPKDELVTAMNAIADFIGIDTAAFPRYIKAVLAILECKGINLEWDEKEKKFRRHQ